MADKREPTIEIRAGRLGKIHNVEWDHLYIVYTDEKGHQCYLRGGPEYQAQGALLFSEVSGGSSRSSSMQSTKSSASGTTEGIGSNPTAQVDMGKGGPFGHIQTEVMWLDPKAGNRVPIDYHPGQHDKSVVVSRGPQCKGQFEKMCQEMNVIQASETRYNPLGPNSNSAVTQAARKAGIEPKLPEGAWAPGSEQSINTSKATPQKIAAAGKDGNHEPQKPASLEPPGAPKDERQMRMQALKDKMRDSTAERGPAKSGSREKGD